MWFWTTIRKLKTETIHPEGMPKNMGSFLGAMVPHETKVVGYVDFVAIIDSDTATLIYEAPANEDNPYDGVILAMHGEAVMLADTLDDIAAKVGAPPRPKVEVPDAFNKNWAHFDTTKAGGDSPE